MEKPNKSAQSLHKISHLLVVYVYLEKKMYFFLNQLNQDII